MSAFDEILSRLEQPSPAVAWLLEAGPIAKRLNEESKGDCAARTVATREPSLRSRPCRVTINYRKEESRG